MRSMPQSKSSLPATAGLPRRAGALGRVALLGALLGSAPSQGSSSPSSGSTSTTMDAVDPWKIAR